MTYRTLRSVLFACLIFGARIAEAQSSTNLVLAADVEGRFIVRNDAKELIAEVYKPAGRTLSLAVDPGVYEVRVERDKSAQIAKVTVGPGADVVLDRQQLGPAPVQVTTVPAHAD